MNYKTIFKRQTKLIAMFIIALSIIVIGCSYSLFINVSENTQNQVVTAGDLSITYANGKTITNNDCLNPVSDNDAKNRTNCTYNVKITNNGTLDASYQVIIYNDSDTSNLVEHKYLRISANNVTKNLNELSHTSDTLNETDENKIKYVLDTGNIKTGETISMNVVIWLNNNAPYTISDKNVSLKIEVKNVVSDKQRTPMERIMEQLDEENCPELISDTYYLNEAFNYIYYNSVLCPAFDNYYYDTYKETYYFIGGNLNYVSFAGFKWIIVRINGDGSIRMVKESSIGSSAFNENANDNAYVGYMYGKIGASSYKEAHQNINDSTIKKKVDLWYKENILNKGYSDYVSDTLFCNDRKLLVNDNYNADNDIGYGTKESYYRWATFPDNEDGNYLTFYCSENDALTVSDETHGNTVLTYPIGLLTSDENYANGLNLDWDMSASFFDGTSAYVGINVLNVDNADGEVYPVINLKEGSLKSGLGTKENPFTLN